MIGKYLLSLADAIKEHEGWITPDQRSSIYKDGSIAFRNNNPGNLRASPFEVDHQSGFSYFYNEDIGHMALLWDLYEKCTGNTVTKLSGASSLADLITVFAPPNENDTEAYIASVEAKTGLPRSTKLAVLLTK